MTSTEKKIINTDIKYKAWDRINKSMRLVWCITWDFSPSTPSKILCVNPVIKGEFCLHDGDYDLIKFVGITDINEKDIYEGDIFGNQLDGYTENCYVGYVEGILSLINSQSNRPLNISKKSNCNWCDVGAGSNSYKPFEVIGNIYENPELLQP